MITRTEVEECFAVIDDEIVWHGGMNLLGKADVWDNLMRIRNSQVATELLEIALGCSEAVSYTHLDVYKRQVLNWLVYIRESDFSFSHLRCCHPE